MRRKIWYGTVINIFYICQIICLFILQIQIQTQIRDDVGNLWPIFFPKAEIEIRTVRLMSVWRINLLIPSFVTFISLFKFSRTSTSLVFDISNAVQELIINVYDDRAKFGLTVKVTFAYNQSAFCYFFFFFSLCLKLTSL